MAYPKQQASRYPHLHGIPFKATPNDIISAVRKYKGNISKVADHFGVCRLTIQKRVDSIPEIKEAVEQERERFVDALEQVCEKDALEQPSQVALRVFLLKTRGQKRGYSMKEDGNVAQDIAKAAFDFVLNKGANPAE